MMMPDNEFSEMVRLLPQVISTVKEGGLDNIFLQCFQSIEKGIFPLDNIAFLLWTEVVQWFGLDNTCSMRYSEEAKKFGSSDGGFWAGSVPDLWEALKATRGW